jgi:hypothetical protein
MSSFSDLFNGSNSPITPVKAPISTPVSKTGSSFSDLFNGTTQKSTPLTPTQPSQIVNKTLMGGGTYAMKIGDPNWLAPTKNANGKDIGHSTYGGVLGKTGYERADVIPVSLSGVNTSPQNIQYEKLLPKSQQKPGELTPTDKYLSDVILPAYKSGKISLRQAQLQSLQYFNENKPETKAALNPYSFTNLFAGYKDTVSGFIKGMATPFVEASVSTRNVLDNIISIVGAIGSGKNTATDYSNRSLNITGYGEAKPLITGHETPKQAAQKVTGTALEIAPYFMGAPEAKSLITTIDTIGAKSIADLSAKEAITFAKAYGTKVATSALGLGSMFGLGGSIKEGSNAKDTAINVAKSIATVALLEMTLSPIIKFGIDKAKGGNVKESVDQTLNENKDVIQQKADELKQNLPVEENITNDPSKASVDILNKGVDLVEGKNTNDAHISYEIHQDLGVNANGEKNLARVEIDPVTKETTISFDKSAKSDDIKSILDNEHQKIVEDRVNGGKELIPETPKSLIQSKIDNYVDKSGLTKEDISGKIKTEINKVGGYKKAVDLVKNSPDLAQTKIPTLHDIMTSDGNISQVNNITHSTLLQETTSRLLKQQEPKYEPVPQTETQANGTSPTKYEPTTAPGKIAERLKSEAIESSLKDEFGDIPEYQKINVKDEAVRVAQIMENPNDAIDIALGKKMPSNGATPEAVFIAVKNQALKEGNYDLLRQLVNEPGGVSRESSRLGQRIKMLDENKPDDAVSSMKKVVQERQKVADKKLKNTTEAKEKVKIEKETKAKVEKYKPSKYDWSKLVDEIACK